MPQSTWSDADSQRARDSWAAFVKRNDLSSHVGKTAGIDPATGRVWIGDSIEDVVAQRDADGSRSLLYFERIGSETYYVKDGRR